ncbi:hypothetical protein [Mycolicibacterium sp. CBMA 361]|uniref:hypothetical protein n=1 Tax=Mycolicibacterium sp. CBMA 361 TaxID=2606610 RepID=UPI001EF0CB78|nr:hypothetical protein [Mycolicibacterium sp. CBMA 361]
MLKTMLPVEVLEDGVRLACRAPSYCNSQPWSWVIERSQLQLFIAPARVPPADHAGHQSLISCGAALDHLRVAMAARRYECRVGYFPSTTSLAYLASIDFTSASCVSEVQRRRSQAISRRHSDRLPYDPPPKWSEFEPTLHSTTDTQFAYIDVIDDSGIYAPRSAATDPFCWSSRPSKTPAGQSSAVVRRCLRSCLQQPAPASRPAS